MKRTKRITTLILAAGMTIASFTGVLMADETTAETTPALIATESTDETTSATQSTQATQATQQTSETTAIDLSGYTFDKIYGSQLPAYINHQYKFQGKDIPMAESNFYLINAFVELSQYYAGYYGTSEGFVDLSAAYLEPSKYATFGDFLVAYSERTLESSCIICSRAEAEGVTLSAETQANIDKMISGLKDTAAKSKVTLDQYLKLYYGDTCDEASFRAVLANYYMADLYTSKYCETHVTDDIKMVPYIRYALFEADQSADEATKTSAENLAKDIITQAAGNIETFKTVADKSASDGYCKDSNDIAVTKGKTVSAFENWAYDAARKDNDMEVIYAPEYGYFAVAYIGKTEMDQASLENILVTQLSNEINEEIESGKYQFGTDQAYEPAKPVPTSEGTGYDKEGTSPFDPPEQQQVEQKSTVKTIIIIICAIVGGVALIAVIIILTVYLIRKINAPKAKKAGKMISDGDDDISLDDDHDDHDVLDSDEDKTEE